MLGLKHISFKDRRSHNWSIDFNTTRQQWRRLHRGRLYLSIVARIDQSQAKLEYKMTLNFFIQF